MGANEEAVHANTNTNVMWNKIKGTLPIIIVGTFLLVFSAGLAFAFWQQNKDVSLFKNELQDLRLWQQQEFDRQEAEIYLKVNKLEFQLDSVRLIGNVERQGLGDLLIKLQKIKKNEKLTDFKDSSNTSTVQFLLQRIGK